MSALHNPPIRVIQTRDGALFRSVETDNPTLYLGTPVRQVPGGFAETGQPSLLVTRAGCRVVAEG